MPGLYLPQELMQADNVYPDPGTGQRINTGARFIAYVPLVSAAAETRTLDRPSKVGQIYVLFMKTDGGDITLTVTGGYDLAGTTGYTFTDAKQMAVFVAGYDGTNYVWRLINNTGQQVPAEILTAARTVRADERGKQFFLDNATGFAITLPAVALGLHYEFIMKTAVTTTAGHTIVCPAGAALFKGHVLSNDLNAASDGDLDTTAVATLTFVINKAVASDRVRVNCDGTNWHYSAEASVFDGFTGT